jgi:O-antigen/teichoic acid export membrane protein
MIKSNIIFNFMSSVAIAAMGFLCLPLIETNLGGESMGIYSLFLLSAAWLVAFDFGASNSLYRELIFSKSGTKSKEELISALNQLGVFLALIIAPSSALLFIIYIYNGEGWLESRGLGTNVLNASVTLIIIASALRILINFARSGLMALEDQRFCNLVAVGYQALRFSAIIISLNFLTQLKIIGVLGIIVTFNLIELIHISIRLATSIGKVLPRGEVDRRHEIQSSPIQYAARYGTTVLIWVLVTQTHNFLLSGDLTLEDFGYYGMMVALMNGILAINSAITQGIQPKLGVLATTGRVKELTSLYRLSFTLQLLFCGAPLVTLMFFSSEALVLLVGSADVSAFRVELLVYLALATILMVLGGVQSSLQVAFGDIRINQVMSFISLSVELPAIIYVWYQFEPIVLLKTIVLFRGLGLITTFIVHKRLINNYRFSTFLREMGSPLGAMISAGIFCYLAKPDLTESDSLWIVIWLAGVVLFILFLGGLASPVIREKV